MPKEFPISPLPSAGTVTNLVDENTPVADVPAAFAATSIYGDAISARDGGLFPPFTFTQTQSAGVNQAINHIQGMQRLRRGKYLIVSGAFATGSRKGSYLFVIRMESRPQTGAWGSNLVLRLEPDVGDSAIAVYRLSPTHWHPGGLSLAGDILAVPLEGGSGTRVAFLHTRDPEQLERFDGVEIFRPDITKAGAVALTRLGDGTYLCATWRDEPDRVVDFHFSNGTSFQDGFHQVPDGSWKFQPFGDGSRKPKYQNINFVTQESGGVRRVFLIGTENKNPFPGAPVTNGPNYADLWEVHPSAISPADSPGALTYVTTHELRALGLFGNFHAAGGTYLAANGALTLYAGYHWRVAGTLHFAEFTGRPVGPVSQMNEGWIELYEVEAFRGKRLGMNGIVDTELRDYRAIFVEGGDFDEEVCSSRFQLPAGAIYRLYSEPGFSGRTLDLVGTGNVQLMPDFTATGFGTRVMSSRYVATI